MTRVSAIIPNRNCQFTTATINDLLTNARGVIEVVVHVDEQFPNPRVLDPRVTYLTHTGPPRGMRAGINAAVAASTGEFIIKTDDHCSFAPGYDVALIAAHREDNWVQVPRRYSLDAERWAINPDRPYRDYSYLCYPAKGKSHDDGMHGVEWWERQRERAVGHDIDDTPSNQGSCYFMTRHHFDTLLGGLDEATFGPFAQEAQEVGLKTWLGGGRLRVNKTTWYAHLHKGRQYGRMYHFDDAANVRAINASAVYWMTDQWAGRVRDFAWFVDELFPNMPTWPKDWKAAYAANAAVPAGA